MSEGEGRSRYIMQTLATVLPVSFDKGSAGTVSTLFYEFGDFSKVGKESKENNVFGIPVSEEWT